MNITRSSMGSVGLIRQKNKSALLAAVAATSTAAAASSFISLSHKPSSSSLPIALDFISKRYKYDNAHDHDDNSRDIMMMSTSWRLSDYSRRISSNNTTIFTTDVTRSFSSNSNSSSSSSSSDDNQTNTTTPSLSSQPNNKRKASSTTIWQPNQTTLTFTKMLNNNNNVASGSNNCKEIISAYAQCVITKQNEGVLTKGVCDKEYNALMDCFRAARLA